MSCFSCSASCRLLSMYNAHAFLFYSTQGTSAVPYKNSNSLCIYSLPFFPSLEDKDTDNSSIIVPSKRPKHQIIIGVHARINAPHLYSSHVVYFQP